MRRRTLALFASFVAVAAFVGVIAAPATPAFATGPTLTVTPSDGLDNGTYVQIHLTGATAQNGKTVSFAECNETVNAEYSNDYSEACHGFGGTSVTNGSVVIGAMVVDGVLEPGSPVEADCTDANNDQCDIVALTFSGATRTAIASKPITFEPPQTPAVTAQPSDNLSDGDVVTVDATGIPDPQSSPVAVEECNTATDESDWFGGACGPTLFYGAASNHEFSQQVNVQYGLGGCDAEASCVIAVLYFDPNTSSNDAVVTTTPISFATPDPQVSVTPTSGLKDGQQLTVSATGVPQEWQAFEIDECNTSYVAAHGGFGQSPNQPGCLVLGPSGTFAAGAMTTKVHVTDGPLSDNASAPVCDHATNGDCAIVLLGYQDHNEVTFTSPQPISFRPPVTGPGTLTVTPATGLYYDAPITVSTLADIKDGIQGVDAKECNIASVKASGYGSKSCVGLGGLTVTNNAVSHKLPVREGEFFTNIQDTRSFSCDDKHACEIGLFAPGLVSSLAPITFRNSNRGKPVVSASKMTGLTNKERVTFKVTHLSDLTREIEFSICNVKAMPGKYVEEGNCRQITPPGSVAPTSNNAAIEKVKVFSGQVGETNSGKKIYCTAKTNGSCAIVAFSYTPGHGTKFVGASKKITYKK